MRRIYTEIVIYVQKLNTRYKAFCTENVLLILSRGKNVKARMSKDGIARAHASSMVARAKEDERCTVDDASLHQRASERHPACSWYRKHNDSALDKNSLNSTAYVRGNVPLAGCVTAASKDLIELTTQN